MRINFRLLAYSGKELDHKVLVRSFSSRPASTTADSPARSATGQIPLDYGHKNALGVEGKAFTSGASWNPFLDATGILPGKLSGKVSKRWLRDQCKCDICVDPVTKQRNLDIFTLRKDRDLEVEKIEGANDISNGDIAISWSDGHRSTYSKAWLQQKMTLQNVSSDKNTFNIGKNWQGWQHISRNPPAVEFNAVMNSVEGLFEWLSKIRQFGFCFVDNSPIETEATRRLIERIGPLTNTHYGQFHEMTADLSSKDTAYTEVALPPHNDTTYFTAPIGLQMLHLLSHKNGTGGESQLVDGFAAALKLKHEDQEAFETLCDMKITTHASGNEGVALEPATPISVLNLDPVSHELVSVRWNPADRQVVVPGGHTTQAEDIDRWYSAAEKFQQLLYGRTDSEVFYEFKLKPGRPVIFDNWRLLHGRSAFTGSRRMCGGYVDHDYFRSTYRAMKQKGVHIGASAA